MGSVCASTCQTGSKEEEVTFLGKAPTPIANGKNISLEDNVT